MGQVIEGQIIISSDYYKGINTTLIKKSAILVKEKKDRLINEKLPNLIEN